MPLAQAVERGDFTGERAERGYLHILLLRHLLHVQVVVAEGLLLGADLIVVGGLEQHASVGAGHAGDGEESHDGGCDEDVGVVQGNGDLAKAAVVLTSYKDDVVRFAHRKPPFASCGFVPLGSRIIRECEWDLLELIQTTKLGKTLAT